MKCSVRPSNLCYNTLLHIISNDRIILLNYVLLHSLFLNCYYIIIANCYYFHYYYVFLQNHYYVLLHQYYNIITLLLHHYNIIIT